MAHGHSLLVAIVLKINFGVQPNDYFSFTILYDSPFYFDQQNRKTCLFHVIIYFIAFSIPVNVVLFFFVNQKLAKPQYRRIPPFTYSYYNCIQ